MEQTMVNFRMDPELKREMERTCKSMGLTMTAAFTMFAVKVTKEQRIPFEITADPFYSEENMRRLRRNGFLRKTRRHNRQQRPSLKEPEDAALTDPGGRQEKSPAGKTAAP